jgi:protein SCO1/2
MKRSTAWLGLAIVAVLAPGCADRAPPAVVRDVGLDQHLDEPVPLDAVFRDELDHTVHLGDYFDGKPVILVLAYYGCPMLCTQVLNGLVDSLRDIPFSAGEQFQVVIVSFDARERPELAAAKKASYVESYGRPHAAAGWHFLTGEQGSIDRLTNAVGFRYVYDPQKDQFAHASGIMVLTPQGRIARYFYGIRYPARDLRLSLVEASDGKIGSPVDRLLLLCYHFDAATGRYTPAVMKFVRLGGIVTLALLGMFLGRAWYRERRRRRQTAGEPAAEAAACTRGE